MIKALMITLGILIIGIGALAIFLPSTRTATKDIVFDFPCEAVWKLYTEIETQSSWRADIASVEIIKSTPPREWIETPQNGPNITFREIDVSPGALIQLKFDSDRLFDGSYSATFMALETGCIGTFTETVMLKGIISKLMSYAFFSLRKSIQRYADEAAQELKRRYKQ